jgi:hypothetical protein
MLLSLRPETRGYFRNVKLLKSVLVRVSVRDNSVTRKLNTIEEEHRDQCSLFRRGRRRNKCRNPGNVLSFIACKMVSAARIKKLAPRPKARTETTPGFES